MTQIVTTDVTNGTTIDANVVNNNNSAIRSVVNGNLDNGNVSASAGLAVSKLAPGTDGQVLQIVGSVPTWVTSSSGLSYGTSLPGSPADGAEAIIVDSTTNPTFQWRFRFNAGSANTDKWEHVGGSDGFAEVATAEATASTSYAPLTTAGPSFTVPLAGVYEVRVEALMLNSSGGANGQVARMSFDIGATGAVDTNAAVSTVFLSSVTAPGTATLTSRISGVAAATALVAKYKVSGGTQMFQNRRIFVRPVRVS